MWEHVRSPQAWRRVVLAAIAWGCSVVLAGCGEPAPNQGTTMPPPEFQQKLAAEHPELFRKKVGKKYEEIDDIRTRRRIVREEWLKQQAKAQ
jgi:hypothetical protein